MHEFIPYSEIRIPDYRQRKVIEDVNVIDLANDIEKNDLLHPISIRASDPPTLVAGGRRLKAIEQLHRTGRFFRYAGVRAEPDTVPCVRITKREELAYLETEYSENAERLDLTWQEKTLARAKLHELRILQTNGGQRLTDTAEELANPNESLIGARLSLADDLRIAENLDDPDVRKAKTKNEAKKILDQKLRHKMYEGKISEIDTQTDRHSIHNQDAVKFLIGLEKDSVDILLTDPPYGMNAHTFGDQTFVNHEYDDTHQTWFGLMQNLAAHSYNVCKSQAHTMVFCHITNWGELAEIFKVAHWDVWPRPLIWYKGNLGTLSVPSRGPRFTYEAILFASKGKKEISHVGFHDVYTVPTATKPFHAAEKPVDLFAKILSDIATPGETVIDPFCGTGTIFPAANRQSLFAIGNELNPTFFAMAAERMEEQ